MFEGFCCAAGLLGGRDSGKPFGVPERCLSCLIRHLDGQAVQVPNMG